MQISHLALLILVTHSSIGIANPLFAAQAVPRSILAPGPSLNDPPNPAEPICIPPSPLPPSPNDLGTFSSDCIEAANSFFNGPFSRQAWHWKLVPSGELPRPGYNFLPYLVAPKGCMIRLDVLDNPDVEDQFALVQIAPDFRRLFTKCVKPNPRAVAVGFVAVGPRRVLKLSIGPTPLSGDLKGDGVAFDGTGLLNVTLQR